MTTDFQSVAYPSTPAVPTALPAGYVTPQTPSSAGTTPVSPEQAEEKSDNLIEMIIRSVVEAVAGVFTFGTSAVVQLGAWAAGLAGSIFSIAETIFGFILDLPLISDVVEVITGQEDGDLNDLGTWGLNVVSGIQAVIDAIVNGLFGWVGELFSRDDAAQAVVDAATTIAGLSAAVTALQNNRNNTEIGGVGTLIDFTSMATASSFGTGFTHIRSGGAGHWGIVNGAGAKWIYANDADTTDNFVYTTLQTTSDYQRVWVAFGSSATWSNGASRGRNEIHGRKNAAGDTYVYAAIEKFHVELGCVVGGTRTVFVSKDFGFSMKANGIYMLDCGTVGGTRIFRLWEGGTLIMTHAEVGSTSQVGSGYRYTGGSGYVASSWLGSQLTGTMWAFALSDNQPATVVGSGARMIRTSTGTVNVSSGDHVLPNSFFNSPDEVTADITYDTTAGSFTVSADAWYDIEFRTAVANLIDGSSPNPWAVGPYPLHLALYKTPNGGTEAIERYFGDVVRGYAYDVSAVTSPEAVSGHTRVFLQAGDSVRIGYNAYTSRSGFFTGDATGLHTYFSIVRTGIKGS